MRLVGNHWNDLAREMELVFSALLDVENQQHVEEEVCGKSSRCLSSNSPPKIVQVKEYKRYEPPNDKEREEKEHLWCDYEKYSNKNHINFNLCLLKH